MMNTVDEYEALDLMCRENLGFSRHTKARNVLKLIEAEREESAARSSWTEASYRLYPKGIIH